MHIISFSDAQASNTRKYLGHLKQPITMPFKRGSRNTNAVYTIASLGGAGLGALAANQATTDEENKTRNTVLGGLAGGALGYSAPKYHFMKKLNNATPEGKVLSNRAHKQVVATKDGNISTAYAKTAKDVEREVEAMKAARRYGLAPEIIESTTGGFTTKSAGKDLVQLQQEGLLNSDNLREYSRSVADRSRRLQQDTGIRHGSFHPRNVMVDDAGNVSLIDWENHITGNKDYKAPFATKKPVGENLSPELFQIFQEELNYR